MGPALGKILVIAGLALAGLGALLWLGPRLPFLGWLGRLPGDFSWRGERFSFYFPLATSLVLSAALTLILWLINRK